MNWCQSFEGYNVPVFPGADVDCLAGRYYWTDVRSATVRSSNYDGTERKPVVSKGNNSQALKDS